MDLNTISQLTQTSDAAIVLLVMDGLGGLPGESNELTELEAAQTPNLDALAEQSVCGLHQVVGPGITPGSGPGHLGLFGYDPLHYQVGRGVLAALGIDFDLQPGDVAVRGNFCSLDDQGRITDRRAGRISSEKNQALCRLLRGIELDDCDLFVETVKDYRFLLVFRGRELSAEIRETDPQAVGVRPAEPEPLSTEAEPTARAVKSFLEQAVKRLTDQHPANMVLLRGFSKRPDWPPFQDVFGLNPAAIAAYPMYRGLAKLVGMEILETSHDLDEQFQVLQSRFKDFDFHFLHVKQTDSAGEDGDFVKKASLIKQVDGQIPRLLECEPDVILVTGDHSTPASLGTHSWHPVPVLLWSKYCRPDGVKQFGERACMSGGLGARMPAKDLMPLALANALRLKKFGA